MDVVDFLRKLGLQQYEAAFRDNGIDIGVLPKLTAEDLKDLGITMVGHRRVLLEAIAALREPTALAVKAGAEAPDAAPMRGTQAASTAEAERRQVTVMFCDLVGSTALAARLDPEDLREVIGRYHACVAQTVARFDGFVAKYMGDGVLVYFGYPHAHEDDTEQAVRAGLALIDAVGGLKAPDTLEMRIGIATGIVVVGDLIGVGSAQEQAIVGETPNLAARLQSLADPNAIVIAESTRRQIGSRFDVQDLGQQALKGFAESQRVWRVLSENRTLGRFETLRSGITPLIGREEELQLLRRWAQAKEGSGRVALISGEPGVGKSRLGEALAEQIATEPHVRLRYFCSPHHQDSALYPVIAQMERAAGFEREDSPSVKLAKLQAVLAATTPPPEEVALIADLQSLRSAEIAPPLEVTPQRKKEKTFEALLRQVERLSRQLPMLMVFEDIHWIDPSSRELLDRTIERIANWPVLLVATFRPEFQPAWTGQPHVTMLALTRLDRRDTAALVANIAGNHALPSEIVREIAERTDGVPLFVEELTKAVLESGTQGAAALSAVPHPALSVPATLQASLMARLDRLGQTAKDVAQKGAVIGREFGYELLALVADRPEPELREGLDRLKNSGLVFARGVPPQSSYTFKHALVQDAAYGMLLRTRRQQLHARIASVLETQFSDTAETQPDLLAHHFTEAGLKEAAIKWWDKAGNWALNHSAYVEAVSHLERAIGLAETLANRPEHRPLRVRLQVAYGNALIAERGYNEPETVAAFARARELAAEIENAPERFTLLYGLWAASFAGGNFAVSSELAESFVRGSQGVDSPEAGVAHRVAGSTCWLAGDFIKSRMHLERALVIHGAEGGRNCGMRFGQDPGVAAMVWLALALWPLGEVDRACRLSAESYERAQRDEHIATRAYGHILKCVFEALLGDLSRALPQPEAHLRISRDRGMQHVIDGWIRWHSGEREAGRAILHEGINFLKEQRFALFSPLFSALQADVEAGSGQTEEAISLLHQMTVDTQRSGQHWFDAELHRRGGVLLLQRKPPNVVGAEAAFLHAVETARCQRARSFELRAAMCLARLWRDQGKRMEARDLLAPIYNWFTEGFDAPDLVEAKALLDELAVS